MKSISITGILKFITAATLLASSFHPAAAANSESSPGPLHSQIGRSESGFVESGEDRRPTNVEEEDRSEAVLKEHEFVRRFNNLSSALLNFAPNYNGLARAGEIRTVQPISAWHFGQLDQVLEKPHWQ